MNRIYGKPEAALVAHVPPNPAADVIRAMSLEEKLELLRRLRGDDLDNATPALPVVEPVPPTALTQPQLANRVRRPELLPPGLARVWARRCWRAGVLQAARCG
jgi:hypothetical protein